MIEIWRFGGHRLGILIVLGCLLCQNLGFCWSLNDEGLALLRFREGVVSDPFGALSDWNDDIGVIDPCSWSGVECWDGNVVILNLKDLCLRGTLAPDLGNLVHLKSIILRNNSFHGIIPEVIGELKELELLDLGYNNFNGPLPSDLGTYQSLTILLLDNNELFGTMYPEIHELKTFSAVQVDDCLLSNSAQKSSCSGRSISWNGAQTGDAARRKLLEKPASNNKPASDPPTKRNKSLPKDNAPSPSPSPSPLPSFSPSPSPSPELKARSSSPSPSPKSEAPYSTSHSPASSTAPTAYASPHSLTAPMLSPVDTPNISAKSSNSNRHRALILSAAIGGPMFLFALVIGIFFCRGHKVVTVRPGPTGLSGQLQKTFVTGVPSLKRSELEAACEDFSNVIGSSSIGSVYKGTLSNGVEIAVTSIAVTSAKDWSNNLEAQFRNKINSLSKVNHKNFVNLLGYCEEAEPFTRMLVFEYAPNGTLFEHLHIKEAEHLDWGTRMRITMGIAYCLERMHQLKPRIAHKNLNSLAVNLTEDYASKVSDFGFWSEASSAAEMESNHESNVYSFGVMLFETVTGRLPYSVDSGSIEDWASDYLKGDRPLREMVDPTLESFEEQQLRGNRPLREMVDPTLKSFEEQQVEQICEVIKSCVHHNPKRRPTMREVTARLREITAIGPDGAVPKRSPLWWAELEILSTEAS